MRSCSTAPAYPYCHCCHYWSFHARDSHFDGGNYCCVVAKREVTSACGCYETQHHVSTGDVEVAFAVVSSLLCDWDSLRSANFYTRSLVFTVMPPIKGRLWQLKEWMILQRNKDNRNYFKSNSSFRVRLS